MVEAEPGRASEDTSAPHGGFHRRPLSDRTMAEAVTSGRLGRAGLQVLESWTTRTIRWKRYDSCGTVARANPADGW